MLVQKKRSALKYISPITEQIEVALIIEECKCFPRFNQLCIKTNRKWKLVQKYDFVAKEDE